MPRSLAPCIHVSNEPPLWKIKPTGQARSSGTGAAKHRRPSRTELAPLQFGPQQTMLQRTRRSWRAGDDVGPYVSEASRRSWLPNKRLKDHLTVVRVRMIVKRLA